MAHLLAIVQARATIRKGNSDRDVSATGNAPYQQEPCRTWAGVADGSRHGAVRLAASQGRACTAVGWTDAGIGRKLRRWSGSGRGSGRGRGMGRGVEMTGDRLHPAFARVPTPYSATPRVFRHRRLAAGGLGRALSSSGDAPADGRAQELVT